MSSSLTLQVADAVKDALGGEPAFRYSDAYGIQEMQRSMSRIETDVRWIRERLAGGE